MKDSFQHSIFDKIRNFLCETQGSTAVEYATLLGLIVATLLPVFQKLGNNIRTVHDNVAGALDEASSEGELPPKELPPPSPPRAPQSGPAPKSK